MNTRSANPTAIRRFSAVSVRSVLGAVRIVAMRLFCASPAILMNTARAASPGVVGINKLPWQTGLPKPFVLNNGKSIKTAADWKIRRAELIGLFLRNEYGTMPPMPLGVNAKILSSKHNAVTLNLNVHTPGTAGRQPVIYFHSGVHSMTLPDWRAVLDFADEHLRGKKPRRLKFDNLYDAHAPKLFIWKTPPAMKQENP